MKIVVTPKAERLNCDMKYAAMRDGFVVALFHYSETAQTFASRENNVRDVMKTGLITVVELEDVPV